MGRVDEATALMNRVLLGNGIQEVPAFSRVFMRSSVSRPPRSRMGRCAQMLRSLLDLFSRRHRRPVLLLIGVQFSLAFGYYGLLLWFPELFKRVEAYGGSACSLGSGVNGSSTFNDSDSNACDPQVLSASRPYMESFLVNASNLPGNLLSIVLMDRLGRRTILSASMLLTAVSVFLVATVRVQWQALALSCAFAGLSASGWNALGVVSTELLPTGLRSTALGVSGALSRVASLLSNLMFGALIDAGCAGPLISAAGLMTLGSLLACLFPNTTG
uniref:MFS domain-containing protein n=1 Tax=Macrostomum lignano TaxID=282301 RepID=A0A1I8JQV0_9PLAT